MCYNRYLYWLFVQAVLITDIVKNTISAVDIIADPIIGTSLAKYVLTASSPKIHVYYNLSICTVYSCSVA